jgi:hypothetical protein
MIKQTLNEWMEEGKQHFGKDFSNWKFKCPVCERVSSIKDFEDLGADPNDAYQKCIGRVNGKGTKNGEDKGYGCNWAAYGLFGTLGKGRKVIAEDGREVEVFDFAIESVEKEAI